MYVLLTHNLILCLFTSRFTWYMVALAYFTTCREAYRAFHFIIMIRCMHVYSTYRMLLFLVQQFLVELVFHIRTIWFVRYNSSFARETRFGLFTMFLYVRLTNWLSFCSIVQLLENQLLMQTHINNFLNFRANLSILVVGLFISILCLYYLLIPVFFVLI